MGVFLEEAGWPWASEKRGKEGIPGGVIERGLRAPSMRFLAASSWVNEEPRQGPKGNLPSFCPA